MAGRFTVAGCGSIARCHGFLSVHPACLRAIADRQVVAMQLGQRRHARIDVTRDRPGRIDRHSGGTATVSIDGRSTFSLSCRPNLPVARVACTNQGEKGHLLLALGGGGRMRTKFKDHVHITHPVDCGVPRKLTCVVRRERER